jgi:hypothetical protein
MKINTSWQVGIPAVKRRCLYCQHYNIVNDVCALCDKGHQVSYYNLTDCNDFNPIPALYKLHDSKGELTSDPYLSDEHDIVLDHQKKKNPSNWKD